MTDPIRKAVIDPGHSETYDAKTDKWVYDPGACHDDIYEERKVLAVCQAAHEYLLLHTSETAIIPVMTRIGDERISNQGRVDFVGRDGIRENALCMVSVHYNSSDKPSANGAEILILEQSLALSLALADIMKEHWNALGLFKWRRYKKLRDVNRGFWLMAEIRKLGVPHILLECGFLSNKNDRRHLTDIDTIELMGKTIGEAIIGFGKGA